jgi:endonuclease G
MHHRFRAAFALLGFALFAAAAPVSAKNCSSADKAAADAALVAFSNDPVKVKSALGTQLPWGLPAATAPTTNEMLLVEPDYVIGYDADLRVPIWTAEKVDSRRLDENVVREDCFRGDPRLQAGLSALPSDYSEPIYDQGHMTPFADQRYSKMAGWNSFVMTNMAPQNCQLNRGIWQILEQISRRYAAEHDAVYVFNGSVFDRDGDGLRDPDAAAPRMKSRNGKARVAVPSAFFKIVALPQPDGSVATLSILLPHDEANPTGKAALDYLGAHVTDLATLERLTGLDLFPAATSVAESKTLWAFGGYKPQSLCNLKPKAAAIAEEAVRK